MKRISINTIKAFVVLVNNDFKFFNGDADLDIEGCNIYRLINNFVEKMPEDVFIYRAPGKKYNIIGLTDFGAKAYAVSVDIVASYNELDGMSEIKPNG